MKKLFLVATALAVLFHIIINFSGEVPRIGKYSLPVEFSEFRLIPITGGASGPESIVFDSSGDGPYTGVSDGRIVKWLATESRWIDFAVTSPIRDGCEGPHDHDRTEEVCGRPLGLGFDHTNGDLYITDAYMGLLKVGPQGGVANNIVTRVHDEPLTFTNGVYIDQRSGVVYFTDSSSVYQRRNYISVIISGDRTGRLMKYDPSTQQATTLLRNLSFPNGVVLSENGDYLLVAETTTSRILRYWLNSTSPKTDENYEVFAEVPGFPDNIKRSPRGGYWVGLNTRRERLAGLVTSNAWLGRAVLRLVAPEDVMRVYKVWAKYRGSGLAVRLSEGTGEILETFEDKNGNNWRSISEVEERDGVLWVGSVNTPFAGMYKIHL